MQAQEISQGVVEATNSVHDNVNPPMELVVNALLDAYFGGIALQIPSMQIAPPPAAPIRSLVSAVEHPVQESSPGYRIQKPGAAIDPQILAEAREAAALRHGDDPLPIPEAGTFVMNSPAVR
jgi:hypothetical protein